MTDQMRATDLNMANWGESNFLDLMAKHAIDGAVNAAFSRMADRFGDDRRDVQDVAHAAACIAVEQFKTLCKNELALIQLDHKRRVDERMLRSSAPFVQLKP